MPNPARIFIAGHRGMVGSAIERQLVAASDVQIVTRTRSELDLTNQAAVQRFFALEAIDVVYLAAARVGGIQANNSFPAEFIYENLMIETNVIHAAFQSGVKKLLFLGSSCIYPKLSEQPMREEALLSGHLEPTNEPYAIAKIAGVKLCESYNRQYGASHGVDYRSIMPTNLYGPGDNYHPENSHVIPGLLRRFHEAKIAGAESVTVWGTGTPRREFLYVDDLARAAAHVMSLEREVLTSAVEPMRSHINVGVGYDMSIRDLAENVRATTEFSGEILFDTSKPDGTARKLMNSERLRALGWTPETSLEAGLEKTYQDFKTSVA